MGEADWAFLNQGLDVAAVARGVTTGVPRAPGGGNFLYAFNSLTAAVGAVGLFADMADFVPMTKGGSIRGAMQRGPGGGATGFAPFLFLCCQGTSVNDTAYMLGLSDDDPHRIVLKKGSIATGLPDADGPGVLLKSSASFSQGTWVHLRLDVIVNLNGDVVLRCFANDLSIHPLGSTADWQPIGGMDLFVDDALSINSGSRPLTSGRGGFGFFVKDVTRRAFFDSLELSRQV